jgi:hypothetical protein
MCIWSGAATPRSILPAPVGVEFVLVHGVCITLMILSRDGVAIFTAPAAHHTLGCMHSTTYIVYNVEYYTLQELGKGHSILELQHALFQRQVNCLGICMLPAEVVQM